MINLVMTIILPTVLPQIIYITTCRYAFPVGIV